MSEQDRAASALHHLDATCSREHWVKAGMAAKSAGLAFDDFHTWSANGANYKAENDCMAVWRSIKTDKGVGAATLFQMALMQGWKDTTKGESRGMGTPIARPAKVAPKPAIQAESGKAAHVWELCPPATPAHPYIAKKGGVSDGLRIYPHGAPPLYIQGQNVAGWLVVPCLDGGKLQTLQFVPGEGQKLNMPGASFNDGFFTVGEIGAGGSVYVVEGVGQAWAVHAATGAAAVVCFGAGRMATVAASVRAKHPAARLVLVPDRAKENQAAAIAAAVHCEWCELPTDKPANYDANDYAMEHGADALAIMLDRTKTPPMRFKLLSAADLSNAPPMRWMVRGVLPLDGLAALYGPSGSGKSFLVLDVAAAVAGGAYDWFGRRVTQCPVTYCALEGEAGMGKRVNAWSRHNRKPVPACLRFITQPLDLLAGSDVVDLAKAVQVAGGAGGLVILDTLNRAAPGADENSSVDMGNIIAAAKRLQNLTGGLVLLVHHTGKDATKGLRGHSSLYAALDGAIEVNRTDSRREWSVAKSKDDETGAVHAFKLDVVPVGFDDEGEEITSCVAVQDDSVDAVKRVKLPQGGNQKIALDTLAEPLRKSAEFGKDGAPQGNPCIRLDEAVGLVAERLTCDAKRRTERAQLALTALVARGIYGVKGDWLWRI
ncbi:MAG TPA: helicase [Oxalobacteraceae bacterium]|nr:helicase [Oxalobacteraceae bacterium]